MKLSIKFSLVSSVATDCPIRMRISYFGQRLDLRCGYVCPMKNWDALKQRMQPGTKNRYNEPASLINAKLAEEEALITRILAGCEVAGTKIPSPGELKAEFERLTKNEPADEDKKNTVSSLFLQYIKEASRDRFWSMSTLYGNKNVQKVIAGSKIGSRPISELSDADIKSLAKTFIDKGMVNTSTTIYMQKFNSFLNWCREKKLYNGDQYKSSLRGLSSSRDIAYLEWDEVLKMKDASVRLLSKRVARDTFCLQCFTGLRTSDVANLRWSQVHLDGSVPHIIVTTLKTADNIRIELNRYAIEIIQRYEDRRGTYDTVFPLIGLPMKNKHLREIAAAIGLSGEITRTTYVGSERQDEVIARKDAISSHWGRHSFIVHALSIGIPPNVVMKWTGHSGYEAMKPYINVTDSTRVNSMELFNV